MRISVHTLVKNEARFVWYSVMSVLPYVDRVHLWDSGSGDGTLEIIHEILKHPLARNKVFFNQEKLEPYNEEVARQHMLDIIITDWFLMVDADEIWWDDSIKTLVNFIKKFPQKYESIVLPTVNLVGDMYHYQEKQAGKYNLLGKVGHYNIRAINRSIPGLKSLGPHGIWGWADNENKMIQDRDKQKIAYLDAPYLHATHLQRAGSRKADLSTIKRGFKLKHEIGLNFSNDFYYPEVFFRPRSKIVESIWQPMSFKFKFRSFFETPMRQFKRRYLPGRVGY